MLTFRLQETSFHLFAIKGLFIFYNFDYSKLNFRLVKKPVNLRSEMVVGDSTLYSDMLSNRFDSMSLTVRGEGHDDVALIDRF